jgi:transglutaminase-like putative cysteine protease
LCGQSVLHRSNVGAGRATKFGVDATNDFRPGFRFGETTTSAVQRNDVGACFTDGFGRFEIRRNVDIAVDVLCLSDADDWEIGLGSEGGYAGDAFGA